MIDFGLAKLYWDEKTKRHIPYREGKNLTGTASFVSINTHLGREQSRRDDLESVGYLLIYLLKGNLPWRKFHVSKKSKTRVYKVMTEKKISMSPENLCKGLPGMNKIVEFLVYLQTVRNLKFEDTPDYLFLIKLFQELYVKNKFNIEQNFDWKLKDV